MSITASLSLIAELRTHDAKRPGSLSPPLSPRAGATLEDYRTHVAALEAYEANASQHEAKVQLWEKERKDILLKIRKVNVEWWVDGRWNNIAVNYIYDWAMDNNRELQNVVEAFHEQMQLISEFSKRLSPK
jgi:hypothetical protein